MPIHRAVVTRYPGVITDWSGVSLHSSIRSHFTVGNIVRVPITNYEDGTCNQTAYFRIIKHCGGKKFRGVMEDPYYGQEDWFLINNGEERVFTSKHVSEIPLDWKGNEKLKKHAIHLQKGRAVTGALNP
eukprot:TRINITY_DN4163_c0_g1_i4.p1 TRINITY_DN4163_c0_g1~~TRINITY_DN4163_c0_g1_i4.p1  ORF type:complete len:129 (-),score=33.34 TRINITY_DN4163_c0_g1_i4:157-543(-)